MSMVKVFRIRGMEIRVNIETHTAMVKGVDTTRVHNTRNPTTATTTTTTNLMEIYYQNQPQQTRQSKIESMLDQVLESQQNLMVNFNGNIYDFYIELNSNFESLNRHVRKLKKKMVQTGDTIKRQEAFMKGKGDDSLKHHLNAIMDDDFWQVVKEEKLQEGDIRVESSMNFGGSH